VEVDVEGDELVDGGPLGVIVRPSNPDGTDCAAELPAMAITRPNAVQTVLIITCSFLEGGDITAAQHTGAGAYSRNNLTESREVELR
jgi:hypothetical protein